MSLSDDIKKKKKNNIPATVTVGDIKKVGSLSDQIKLAQAAGLIAKPEPVTEQPKEEGFLKKLGKAIINPFAEVGTSVYNAGEATGKLLQGKTAEASATLNKSRNLPFVGEVKPAFTGQENAGEMAKKVAGYGLEFGSYLPFGAGIKGLEVAAKGVKVGEKLLPKIGIGALKGAVEGGIGGTLMGAAQPLEQNQGVGEVLKGAALGGLTGTAFGGALGGVSPIIGAGLKKVAPKTLFPKTAALREAKTMADTIAKREEEIFNIENNYAKTRKAMSYSKDANSASRKRIASTDVLVGAVDQDGLIKTENAVKQYRAMTLDGTEGVVRQNLEREGGSVTADVVKKQLVDNIMNSGLEGKALQRALNGVDSELNGLMLRADNSGKIPLAVLQDAKVNAYGGINFQSEPWIKTEQKTIANAYKKLIEDNSNVRITIGNKVYGIKDINAELGKYLKDIELLENLNGRRVKGGKLGKYFSQISGNIIGGIAGHAVGGPAGSAVGTIVGGELGGRLRGNILSKTLGKATGNLAPESQILKEAAKTAESPRLMLSAPKEGSPRTMLGTGPTINLPSRTQSAIDETYSKSLGNRNIQYNPTATATKKVNIKKEVKPRLKTNKNPTMGKIEYGNKGIYGDTLEKADMDLRKTSTPFDYELMGRIGSKWKEKNGKVLVYRLTDAKSDKLLPNDFVSIYDVSKVSPAMADKMGVDKLINNPRYRLIKQWIPKKDLYQTSAGTQMYKPQPRFKTNILKEGEGALAKQADPLKAEMGESGLRAFSFISPNIATNKQYAQALSDLKTPLNNAIKDTLQRIDKNLGINSITHKGMGHWADGAEETFFQKHYSATDLNYDKLIYSDSIKARNLKQKQFAMFARGAGEDELYQISTKNLDPAKVNEVLKKNKIEFQTNGKNETLIINKKDEYFDKEMQSKIFNSLRELGVDNSNVKMYTGKAEFYGSFLDDDVLARKEASEIFNKNIKQYEQSTKQTRGRGGQLEGNDIFRQSSAAVQTQKARTLARSVSRTDKSVDVSIGDLISIKNEPVSSLSNAETYLLKSSLGEAKSRSPLQVIKLDNGKYLISDGNATYQSLKELAGNQKMKIPVEVINEVSLKQSPKTIKALSYNQKAQEDFKYFNKFVSSIKEKNGLHSTGTIMPGALPSTEVKSVPSILNKLDRNKYLADLNRTTFFIDNEKQGLKVVDDIRKAGGVDLNTGDRKGLNNRFNGNGYQDINYQFKMPNGSVAELQMMTPKMFEAKSKFGHIAYDLKEKFFNVASEKEKVIINKLYDFSMEVYKRAGKNKELFSKAERYQVNEWLSQLSKFGSFKI